METGEGTRRSDSEILMGLMDDFQWRRSDGSLWGGGGLDVGEGLRCVAVRFAEFCYNSLRPACVQVFFAGFQTLLVDRSKHDGFRVNMWKRDDITGLLGTKMWRPTHSLTLQVGQSCRGPLCPAASAGQLSVPSADLLGLWYQSDQWGEKNTFFTSS